MQTLKKLLAVLFISLLVYSWDEKKSEEIVHTIENQPDFKFYPIQNSVDVSYFLKKSFKPYLRRVLDTITKKEKIKILFTAKSNENYEIINITQYSDRYGKHFIANIKSTKNQNLDSITSLGFCELEIGEDKYSFMSSFFIKEKKPSYLTVNIFDLKNNLNDGGYMIISNDKNGGTIQPEPLW